MAKKVLENVKKIAPDKFSKENHQQEKIRLITDSEYSSSSDLAQLEKEQYKEKFDSYIPDTDYASKERNKRDNKDSPFHKSKFIYSEKENSFICPASKTLHYVRQWTNSAGVTYSIYHNYKDCKSCQHFGKCTTNKSGRFIYISEHQHLIDKMRQKLSTSEGKRIYGIRKITAEPVFGNLSQNLGFREFLLRGLHKVKGEFSLMCIAHNLLKIAKLVRGLGITLKEALSMQELLAVADSS